MEIMTNMFDYGIVSGILGIAIGMLIFICREFIKYMNKQTDNFIENIEKKDVIIDKKNDEIIKITKDFKDTIVEIHENQEKQNFIFNEQLKEINIKIDNIEEKIKK